MQGGAFNYNFNQAPEYREAGQLLPDGEHVWLQGTIKVGNVSLPGMSPEDTGIFTQSGTSDAVMIVWEFKVIGPPQYEGAMIFNNMTLAGGQVDDKGQSKAGNISKGFMRGMIEATFGIHPKDESPQAQQYRNIPNLRLLESMKFPVRIGIEEGGTNPAGGNYPDRNYIAKIILPDDPEYTPMRAGHPVEPKPRGVRTARTNRNASGRGNAAPASGGMLWQTEAAAVAGGAAPAPQPQYQQPPAPQYTPAPQPAPAPVYAPPPPAPVAAPAPAPAPVYAPPPPAPATIAAPPPAPAPVYPPPAPATAAQVWTQAAPAPAPAAAPAPVADGPSWLNR